MGRRGGATDGLSSAAGRNRATASRKIMSRVGVLGYGYWGPNIVRNFHAHEQSEVVLVCDKSLKAGERLRKAYPGIPFTADENEILHSTKIDAVCVITPVASHYSLAKRALENGKHIFVEKPFTCNCAQAEELVELEDIAFVSVYFPDRIIAHINVNWLSPVKVRTTLIGCEKKMLVWNDLDTNEKIKVYDKGVSISDGKGLHQLLVSYRSGDMWSPQIEQTEALTEETAYFLECILENKTPFNDGINGLRIVRILEAADKSIRNRGVAVNL